jgi:hypothetical protein
LLTEGSPLLDEILRHLQGGGRRRGLRERDRGE